MKPLVFLALYSVSTTFLGVSTVLAQTPLQIPKFGIGLNYGGAQLDWKPSSRWMFELRGQQGKDITDQIESKSSLLGLRTYRFYRGDKTFSPFFGEEVAYLDVKQTGSLYHASGIAAGVFGGLSFKLSAHFLIEMDIGPYLINLHERSAGVDRTRVDFIGDTSLTFMF